MRLTTKEMKRLLRLLDVMSDRCPHLSIDEFDNDLDRAVFYSVFIKLRLELWGY